ncbi:hypothetical protein MKW94_022908 [Papaver nudicaule]|uniref:Protein kinase domain-containing protein n=1 Tax=Papaver nudicaule TaxID=74823 RepID=A0AA41VQX2_PAPNU|nr:hypothetical protein [Papaver nudicaule]
MQQPSSSRNAEHQILFRDDLSVDKYCAPKGIGKTTLSKRFDIKVLEEAITNKQTIWHKDCAKHRIFGMSFIHYTPENEMNLVIKTSTVRSERSPLHKKEFEEHMELVSNIRGPNVVPVRAYYFSSEDEQRLIVYDNYMEGSVHNMLHGKTSRPLHWDARLRIAIGVAKGLKQIHAQDNGKLVHGNIKSPNIFLNTKKFGCISDLGQSILFPPVLHSGRIDRQAHKHLAPEIQGEHDFKKTLQSADIYSYGTLLVELLYGEINISFCSGGFSSVRDNHLRELFNGMEKQWECMNQIAKDCTSEDPSKRPKIDAVVTNLEKISRA